MQGLATAVVGRPPPDETDYEDPTSLVYQTGAVLFAAVFEVTDVDNKAAANSTALPGKPVVKFHEVKTEDCGGGGVASELTMDIVGDLLRVKPNQTYTLCLTDGLLLATAHDNRQFVCALDHEDYITRNKIIYNHNNAILGSADGLLFHLKVPPEQSARLSGLHADAQVFLLLSKGKRPNIYAHTHSFRA